MDKNDGCKQGFKEGVQAVQIQLQEKLQSQKSYCVESWLRETDNRMANFWNGQLTANIHAMVSLNEICKELMEDDNYER